MGSWACECGFESVQTHPVKSMPHTHEALSSNSITHIVTRHGGSGSTGAQRHWGHGDMDLKS